MSQLGNLVHGPGTNVSDTLETNLLTGATLNSAGTTSATAGVDVSRPGLVAFVLELGTVTGTSPTIDITVTASDTSDFSDDVVTVARVTSAGTNEDNLVYAATAYVTKQYVKASAVVLGGTSPVYTGATLKVRQPHWHRGTGTSAGTLI